MGSRVRIRLFHILHFVMDFLFPLLKNSKFGVDDRGHRFRSGSPLTNYPHAEAAVIHKISIQIGPLISEAYLQLNRHFASDRLLMAASCCLSSLMRCPSYCYADTEYFVQLQRLKSKSQ